MTAKALIAVRKLAAKAQRTEPNNEDDSRHGYLTELRDVVQENAEVYEWWLVSRWLLCEQLRAIGEVVLDNGYGHWWGRTATGQGFIMDGTLQQIAAKHTTLEEVQR